jgi:hypothetical protein
MNGFGSTVTQVRCNRCRKALTVEASRIKGIGPICEKRGLKSLGAKASQTVEEHQREEILNAIRGIEQALFEDFEGTLDYGNLHREKIERITKDGGDHVEILGVTYEVLADVFNQLPGDYAVASATKLLFTVIGAPEEGEAAHKRLSRLIKKTGSGVF